MAVNKCILIITVEQGAPVLDAANLAFKTHYVPPQHVPIDESKVGIRSDLFGTSILCPTSTTRA